MLVAGAWRIDVDEELLRVAAPRIHAASFLTFEGAPDLQVRRVTSFSQGMKEKPLEGVQAAWGFFALEGSRLEGRIPEDAFAAEAVLRAAYHVAVARQGGILIHGSGVAFADEAIVATGPSGAGKSTLARLCMAAGARLLSDEIVALYPDGRCHGTPFRSDVDLQGTPAGARLKSLLLLSHGNHEQLVSVSAREALPTLLAQTFRGVAEVLEPSQWLSRVGTLLEGGTLRLTFRKHPEAGRFLERWMRENRDA